MNQWPTQEEAGDFPEWLAASYDVVAEKLHAARGAEKRTALELRYEAAREGCKVLREVLSLPAFKRGVADLQELTRNHAPELIALVRDRDRAERFFEIERRLLIEIGRFNPDHARRIVDDCRTSLHAIEDPRELNPDDVLRTFQALADDTCWAADQYERELQDAREDRMRWFYRVLLKGIGGVVVITIDNVIGTAAPGLSEAARAFSTLLGSAVAKEIDQAMPTREPAHVGG